MPKITAVPYNYRSLLITIKNNQFSFIFGLIIVLLATSFALTSFLQKAKSPDGKISSKEKKDQNKQAVNKNEKIYIIQPGDQLYLIAEKFYGSGLNMFDIMQANKISNPDLVEIGQKL